MGFDRRQAGRAFGAMLGGAFFSGTSRAQLFGSGNICPPGTVLKEFKIRSELGYQERTMTIFGQSVTQKVPVRVAGLYEVTCAPKEEPPKPPPPPKNFNDIFDLNELVVPFDYLRDKRADQFFVAVNFSAGLAEISSATALFDLRGITGNGSAVASAFSMVRSGNGFRFANPGAVDYWAATTGASVVQSTWSVSGISAVSRSAGAGSFGLSQFIGNTPVNAFSGSITVLSSSGQPRNPKIY